MEFELVVSFLENSSLDFISLTKCHKSCLQLHVGWFRPRMELRQTRRVPPSCNRTYNVHHRRNQEAMVRAAKSSKAATINQSK